VLVELLHVDQQRAVRIGHQVRVIPMGVPGIERVEPDHLQELFGQVMAIRVSLENDVEVFIMAEGHEEVLQARIFTVDAVFALVSGIVVIRVVPQRFVKHDILRICASHGESVSHHRPRGFPEPIEDLADVVYQARDLQVKIVGLGKPDAICGLISVVGIGLVHVRITGIHETVQHVQGIGHLELAIVQTLVLVEFGPDEIHRLIGVLLFVEGVLCAVPFKCAQVRHIYKVSDGFI